MWKLTHQTYWRRDGDDVLLASEKSILRLNKVSARAFAMLLGMEQITTQADARAATELAGILQSEGMVEETERFHNPMGQYLGHVNRAQAVGEL